MSAIIMVCMTSGIEGPHGELTDEQSQTASDLASQLTKPWTGSKFAGLGLGSDRYLVEWDENSLIIGVQINVSGFASIWKLGDNEWHEFTDTVGLWGFLAPIVSPIIQKWMQRGQQEMDEYNEKMFGASK